MNIFFRYLNKVEHFLMGLLASASLLLAVTEMSMRYFSPQLLPDWTAEVVVYLITASVMLSGGVLVSEGRQVNADMFLRSVSSKNQRALEIAFCLVGLFVCGIFFYQGLGIVEFGIRLDERSNSSLQFPMFIYYSFVPLAFGIMFLHYLKRLYTYIFAFDAETMTTTEIDLEHVD